MEQLTKNQAVATYQAGLRRDAVQPDIEAERKKRDEIEAGKSYCSRRFGGATCDDKSAQIYARFDKMIGVSNLPSFIASMTQKLTLSDISDESKNYLDKAGITTACLRIKSKWTAGGK